MIRKVGKYFLHWLGFLFLSGILYYLFYAFIAGYHNVWNDYNWHWFWIDMIYGSILGLLMVGIEIMTHIMFKKGKSSFSLVAMSIAIMILCIGLAYGVEEGIDRVLWPEDFDNSGDLFMYSLVGACLSMIILMLEYTTLLSRQKEHLQKLEVSLIKSQLDPHFMFNNLSTLDELIYEDPATAHEFLKSLSRVYRYFTQYIAKDTVPVSASMDFLNEYIEMLEVRHPGHFRFEISEELKKCHRCAPTMSIHTVTENAIKHNCHSKTEPLVVTFALEGEEIVVKNPKVPIKAKSKTTGCGLANLDSRCRIMCGKGIDVSEENNIFEVRIPLLA